MNISITVNLKIGLSEQHQEIFIDGDAIISHVRRPLAMLCKLEFQHMELNGSISLSQVLIRACIVIRSRQSIFEPHTTL